MTAIREIYCREFGENFVRISQKGRRWFLSFGPSRGRLSDGTITERAMYADSHDGWRLADLLGIPRMSIQ